MPNVSKAEKQSIRIGDVPVPVVRLAKARAALAGMTLAEYLALVIERALVAQNDDELEPTSSG